MIYRIAGSHFALIFITLGIMTVSAGLMTEQIEYLASNYGLDFIPNEIAMEGNIVILIACFGVFLEHRHYLLEKIYQDRIPEAVDRFDRYSHHVGVMFIMVAILIEFLDLLFVSMNSWGISGSWFKFIEIAVLFSANLLTFTMLVIFGLWSFKVRPGQNIALSPT
jgi:hypothetical protein